jgi:hypothetical protein
MCGMAECVIALRSAHLDPSRVIASTCLDPLGGYIGLLLGSRLSFSPRVGERSCAPIDYIAEVAPLPLCGIGGRFDRRLGGRCERALVEPDGRQLHARRDAELCEDAAQVCVDRSPREKQLGCNFFVRKSLGDEASDL